MSGTQRIGDLCAQHGWEVVDEPTFEADAVRARVQMEDGDFALAYAYELERTARRAAKAHTVDYGAQLFTIPQRIESGPGWVLVTDIEGTNLADLLDGSALSDCDDSKIDALVSGVATALSKLHTIVVPGYGDILTDDPDEQFLTFNGWAAHQLESAVEMSRDPGFEDSVAGRIGEAVGQLRHELASYHPRSPAGLVHGRPHVEHMWVDPDTFELVGLTGVHHMMTLPREIDIAIFLWMTGVGEREASIRTFYRSYGAARTMDVQRRERFFKRLAAFLELSGRIGPAGLEPDELIALTSG